MAWSSCRAWSAPRSRRRARSARRRRRARARACRRASWDSTSTTCARPSRRRDSNTWTGRSTIRAVPLPMKALLGDHAVTRHFKAHSTLEFADVKVLHTAFKRVVRDLEFDVAELALMTFLLAKAHGKPYRLLPAVLTARFQHGTLAYNPERGPALPEQLEGKRVGMRSYSVTTAVWVRGILAQDHGVDLGKVDWVTLEEPHVAEFRDPPNATRMPPGKD